MPGVGYTDKESIQQIKSPDVVFAAVTARICSRQFRPSKDTMPTVGCQHIGPYLDSLENIHTYRSALVVCGSKRASHLALYA